MTTYGFRVPVDHKIFDRGVGVIDGMCSQHNKVLPVRCDIRFPAGYSHDGKNSEISELHKRVKQYFSYYGTDLQYFTVREIYESTSPHYHMMLLLDGNKHQSPEYIWNTVEHIWNSIVGHCGTGLVERCYRVKGELPVPPLEVIRRPSSKATGYEHEQQKQAYNRRYNASLGHLEYLAKTVTKGLAGRGNRQVFASQARKK